VLEATEVPRPVYARLLVQMAGLRTVEAPGLARPAGLDQRIAAVLASPARARLGAIHALALGVWIVLALGGARPSQARDHREVCVFTPEVAEALLSAHPEADRDGDGVLSRDEACDYQAELIRRGEGSAVQPPTDADVLIAPLCCNCDPGDGLIPSSGVLPIEASCQRAEGVDE
jgi:hypothetical protein